MVDTVDRSDGSDFFRVACGNVARRQRALTVCDQVNLLCAGFFQNLVNLLQQLLPTHLVAVGSRQTGDIHTGATLFQSASDAEEIVHIGDALETEQAMDQQDRETGSGLSIHRTSLSG